jgi:hypothetical protein
MRTPSHTRQIVLAAIFVLTFAAHARAGATSLLLTGDPGDYISGGQTHYYTPADGVFTAYINQTKGVSVAFNTPGFGHWWYVNFDATGDQQLTPGVYTNAVRWPLQTSTPGLSVYGDGRGCNTLTGSFDVKEVVYGTDAFGKAAVLSFRATFEQHCEGFAVAARGEIRYNATVPIEMTAPTAVNALERDHVSFGVSAADTQGRNVRLSAIGVPPGATFIDNGNNTGTFSWLPAEGQAGSYFVTFRGDNGAGNVETTFTVMRIFAAPPVNDDFAAPIDINEFPYTHVQNTTRATSAVDDPFCNGSKKTVWYSFTPPADMRVEFNTFGSDYDTILSVYRGARGALIQEACNDNAGTERQSRVRFDARGGITYWVMVGGDYWSVGGRLQLNALPAPPPLAVGLTIDNVGGVDPTTGLATVNGSVTCSRPVLVSISGQLKQDHAQSSLTGKFGFVVACDGTTDWATAVVTAPGVFQGRAADLFVAGRASVSATATALDQDTGETVYSNAVARIVLRGGSQ